MKKIVLFALGIYHNYLSALKLPTCRFYPTCSHYASEAIHKKGLAKGIALSIKRVLKCHPFFKGGYDPVV